MDKSIGNLAAFTPDEYSALTLGDLIAVRVFDDAIAIFTPVELSTDVPQIQKQPMI